MLTDNMIRSGIKFIELLDANNINPKAVFWLYFPDDDDWKLIIAKVDDNYKDPKKFYEIVRNIMVLHKQNLDELTIHQVKLALPNAPIVQLLSFAMNTGDNISGIKFTGNVINGTLIDDAYIYRMTH